MIDFGESTDEIASPYPLRVSFLFSRNDSNLLDVTMRSLGASPKGRSEPGWLFCSGAEPLVDFSLNDDVDDFAIDVVWEVWSWYVPLLEALGVESRNTVILDVQVQDCASAFNAVRTFALELLTKHRGVVRDSISNQVWTHREIANTSIPASRSFFGDKTTVAAGLQKALPESNRFGLRVAAGLLGRLLRRNR